MFGQTEEDIESSCPFPVTDSLIWLYISCVSGLFALASLIYGPSRARHLPWGFRANKRGTLIIALPFFRPKASQSFPPPPMAMRSLKPPGELTENSTSARGAIKWRSACPQIVNISCTRNVLKRNGPSREGVVQIRSSSKDKYSTTRSKNKYNSEARLVNRIMECPLLLSFLSNENVLCVCTIYSPEK